MSDDKDILYLLVEDGPLLAPCQAWKSRYQMAVKACFDLARSVGAKGYFPGFYQEFLALTVVDPIPAGWARAKQTRRSDHPRMVPAKGEAGNAPRALIAALPEVPKWQEIAELIGHPLQVSWHTPDGNRGFESCGFDTFTMVRIGWTRKDFVIVARDPKPQITDLLRKNPDAILDQGEWSPPAGLHQITKARWELMVAQHRVEEEEVAT